MSEDEEFQAELDRVREEVLARVLLYTTAPAAYDGFSTREIAPDCGRDNRGYVVRKVSLESRDLDWQVSRYESGMHAWTTKDEAKEFPQIWRLTDETPDFPDLTFIGDWSEPD